MNWHCARQRGSFLSRVACAGLALLIVVVFLPQIKADEPTSTLKLEVVAADNGKPIANASIYVKFKEERTLWRDKQTEWHAKTNRDGLAQFKEIPRGKVLIQIVASGWKTYGKYYDVTQAEEKISIKLDRPRRWY